MANHKWHWIQVGPVRKSIRAWADELGASPPVIYNRLYNGWPADKAVTTPIQRHQHKCPVCQGRSNRVQPIHPECMELHAQQHPQATVED